MMAGADARAVVAVEIFVEQDQVPPMRIVAIAAIAAVHRAPAFLVLEEDARQPSRQLGGHIPEGQIIPRARRVFHFEVVAEVMMKFLQRFDDQVIQREPDGTAPVRIAAEKAGAGFSRLIVHAILGAAHGQHVRVVLVSA